MYHSALFRYSGIFINDIPRLPDILHHTDNQISTWKQRAFLNKLHESSIIKFAESNNNDGNNYNNSKKEIISICFSYDAQYFAVVDGDGILNIYNFKNL